MNNTVSNKSITQSKTINVGLWTVQILLALVYIPAGLMKMFAPVNEVAENIPWASDVAEWFLRGVGAVDFSAGVGVLLPALTRIYPRLTVLAAFGSITLQLFAMVFHISRGEYAVIPFNACLVVSAVFVAWGRLKKVPIVPR